jgi:ABC-2 type transport system ATP-binding protein
MNSSNEPAIEAIAVRKSYGAVAALDGVDLRVPRGSVTAVLGPNGAGKTTAVRILSTLLRADAGEARVAGFDVLAERKQVRRRLSVTGQDGAVDLLLSGAENLRVVGRLRGLSRASAADAAAELLERFDLADVSERRASTYSGGMRRRLDLAAGLVGAPEVIVLDEPTTGLDPRSRREMWDSVRELVTTGASVLLTTQYLEEADRLADQIVFLDGGRVVAQGTPEELKEQASPQRLELTLSDGQAFAEIAAMLRQRVVRAYAGDLLISVSTDGSAAHVRALLDELDPHRHAITRFAIHTATLDDVFLTLTGQPSRRPEPEAANV